MTVHGILRVKMGNDIRCRLEVVAGWLMGGLGDERTIQYAIGQILEKEITEIHGKMKVCQVPFLDWMENVSKLVIFSRSLASLVVTL